MTFEDSSEPSRRRLLAALAAGAAGLTAGCTELGGRFEDGEENATPESAADPVERAEGERASERLGFGEAWEVPGTALTVTLEAPSITGQVGRISAPRRSTWASVTARVANEGEERDSVDVDGFHATVDGERYDHDSGPQGGMVSGIAEPGATLEKDLYFAVPEGTNRDDITVRYEDLVRWG